MQRMGWALAPDPELALRLKRSQGRILFCSLPLTLAALFLPHSNCSSRLHLSPNHICNINTHPNPRHQLSLPQHAQPRPGWKMSHGKILFMSYPSLPPSLVAPSASLGMVTILLLIQSLTLTPVLTLGWVLAQGTQPQPRWVISQGKLLSADCSSLSWLFVNIAKDGDC